MSAITTHILDTSTGRPAAAVDVLLEFQRGNDPWTYVGRGQTDADGRQRTLMPPGTPLTAGTYRLVFHTREYFDRAGVRAFYPHVIVVFDVTPGETQYHVPLLLNPFGYTTYRGT